MTRRSSENEMCSKVYADVRKGDRGGGSQYAKASQGDKDGGPDRRIKIRVKAVQILCSVERKRWKLGPMHQCMSREQRRGLVSDGAIVVWCRDISRDRPMRSASSTVGTLYQIPSEFQYLAPSSMQNDE